MIMAKDLFDLTGRTAIITGASSRGIGSGAAKALAQHGANVFLLARRGEELKKQAAEIEAGGGKAAYAVCDVSDEQQCADAVNACAKKFGRIDIMVLAAGIAGKRIPDDSYEFDSADWEKVLRINLYGQFYMYKYACEYLAKGGVGSVITVSSLAALKVSGALAYTASKGALYRMIPWYAKKLGPLGIRVNAICPGLVDTDMVNPPGYDTTDALLKPRAQSAPLGRCASIEDCANLILFLASDASRCITGNHITVDGGEVLV